MTHQCFQNFKKSTRGITSAVWRAVQTQRSVKSRYTRDGLSAVLVDLHFLSMCDFVVCTFTSNVCRAVYELMQTRHGDASSKVYSLDSSVYFLTDGDIHYKRAVVNHQATSNEEISLQVGDLVQVQTYVFRSNDRQFRW
ncbi:alpha-(1,6)-fucosyltransferase-like [Pomacea canaliculata]|uniref:alpha-(1,6)-fucosyltransferase-like n=1 Tax=Pomacea canaliculata TaxID=400727 RepID=UPI000D7324F8|nr:alpha-(1,6)-fucosyltransferase-like [Pomacea canaliculata]